MNSAALDKPADPPADVVQNDIAMLQFFLDIGADTGDVMAVGTVTFGPCHRLESIPL